MDTHNAEIEEFYGDEENNDSLDDSERSTLKFLASF